MQFELSTGKWRPAVSIGVSVRIDIAIFWQGSRTLAVVHRDQLRDPMVCH